MYENLIREMAVCKVSIENIAQFLDKNRKTISNKLNGAAGSSGIVYLKKLGAA